MRSIALVVVLAMILSASSKQFWLTIELEEVNWLDGCNLIGTCAQPKLHLSLYNMVSNETVSKAFDVKFNKQQHTKRSLTVHWNEGRPGSTILIIGVDGIDPIIGFPRTCDSTTETPLFTVDKNIKSMEIAIEVSGNCFEARLICVKHEEHCPWCVVRGPTHDQELNSHTNIPPGLITAFISSLTALLIVIILTFAKYAYNWWKSRKTAETTSDMRREKAQISTVSVPNIESSSSSSFSSSIFERIRKPEQCSIILEPENLSFGKLSSATILVSEAAAVLPRQRIISANSSFCNSELY